MADYSGIVVERLEHGVSDHRPQLLKFDRCARKHGLLKFYNVFADHEHFEGLIRENWGKFHTQNLLWNIWMNCKQLKGPLKTLNTTWFVRTSERVAALKEQLKGAQQIMASSSNSD